MIDASKSWGRLETLPAGNRLAYGSDRGDRCYIVLEGMLVLEKQFERGGRQIVQMLVPGDMCGFSALSGGSTGYDIVALSPVSCLSISSRWLTSLANDCPDLREAIWREMSREAAISAAWVANNSQRRAYPRLAHLICELEARWRPRGSEAHSGFEWWGTQGDLKDATGLSLVHLNKTLRRLETDGLLSYGRRVKVHDVAKLGLVAGFDPAYLTLDRERLGTMLLSHFNERDETQRAEAGRYFTAPVRSTIASPGMTA